MMVPSLIKNLQTSNIQVTKISADGLYTTIRWRYML